MLFWTPFWQHISYEPQDKRYILGYNVKHSGNPSHAFADLYEREESHEYIPDDLQKRAAISDVFIFDFGVIVLVIKILIVI